MSPTQTYKQIDSWLRSRFKAQGPGMSVIVVQDGKTQFRTGYGMANVELGVPVRPEHVFRLGSITKQFTAVAVLMLMERGKLALGDRITKFVPRYPTHGHKITIEHLLTHTSGIRSYTDMPEFWQTSKEDKTLEDQIAFFKDQPMDFKSGERWHYNNSGYLLLGAIIEKVSGLTYTAFLQKHIFDPLGMAHTYYDMPEKIIPGRVAGYGTGATGIENAPYLGMTRPYAAGALASNVDDLAKWDAALYTDKLVKQRTLKQAWTSRVLKSGQDTHYGYGWAITPFEGNAMIEHGGGINGFRTFALRVPEHKLFVAVLANSNNPALSPEYVAVRLALNAMGHPHQEPEAVSLSSRALAKFVGQYKTSEGQTTTFTRKSSQLSVQFWDGMPPLALRAVSANEFALTDSFLQLRFETGPSGTADKVLAYERGVLRDTAIRIQ